MPEGFNEPIPVPPLPFVHEPKPTPIPLPGGNGKPIPIPSPEPAPAPVPAPPVVPPAPPPEPTIPGGLPDLGILGALLVIFALIALADALRQFLDWLFGFKLRKVPGGNRASKLTTKTLLQPMSNYLGTWEQGIDAQIGLSFQKLASLQSRLGASILAAELAIYQAVVHLRQVVDHSHEQDKRQAATSLAARVAASNARTGQRLAMAEAHRAQLAEHAATQHAAGLQHNITHVLEPELDALRHRIPTLEHGLSDAWDTIKKHEGALSIAGITAATAVGLSRLGADWVRCEANQVIGRANCESGPQNARNLLQLLLGAGLILSLEEYVKIMQPITRATTEGIQTILKV